MFLDILLLIVVVLAVIRGYQRGLIVGVFSFVAVIIGLAAAIKLSAVVADYLGDNVNISGQWLPVISFLVVFIGVVLLIRLGANFLQKSVEWTPLGWVNRLGGILFYVAIYLIVYSVALFYAGQLKLIQPATAEASLTYAMIEPWGPRVVDGFAVLIPTFRDMFSDLQQFFGGVAEKVSTNPS